MKSNFLRRIGSAALPGLVGFGALITVAAPASASVSNLIFRLDFYRFSDWSQTGPSIVTQNDAHYDAYANYSVQNAFDGGSLVTPTETVNPLENFGSSMADRPSYPTDAARNTARPTGTYTFALTDSTNTYPTETASFDFATDPTVSGYISVANYWSLVKRNPTQTFNLRFKPGFPGYDTVAGSNTFSINIEDVTTMTSIYNLAATYAGATLPAFGNPGDAFVYTLVSDFSEYDPSGASDSVGGGPSIPIGLSQDFNTTTTIDTRNSAPVPEPGGLALAIAAALGLVAARRGRSEA